MSQSPALIIPHCFPESTPPKAVGLELVAQGLPLDLRRHQAADFTSFECEGPIEVTATFSDAPGSGPIVIRPLRHGVEVERCSDSVVRFTLPGPDHYQLEVPGRPVLYIYGLARAVSAPEGAGVRCFEAGKVHEVGTIGLRDGETLWIEPGAVVRGHVVARNAAGVRIGGGGLLQGSLWPEDGKRRSNVLFAHCRDVLIEDLLITAEEHWMILLGNCDNVRIHRVREIGSGVSTDGIDIVGSRNVTISGCCLHNGDDNIALKAIDFSANLSHPGAEGEDFTAPVEHIRVSGCVFFNNRGGSAMEIGYETRTGYIRDGCFEDIDVLAVHEFGSVFGIHNGDRAQVEDVHWRDVRVEHHYDKLVDFRVLKSRWNSDPERGCIRNVSLTDIQVHPSIYNAGYTVSVLAGFDADHTVENIRFRNFRYGSEPVLTADKLDLVTRHAHKIRFE